MIKEHDVFFCYYIHLLYYHLFVLDFSLVPPIYPAASYTNKNEGSCLWRL